MRKYLVAAMVLVSLVAFVALQYQMLRAPGAQEWGLRLVQDTPAHIFWPIFIGYAVLTTLGSTLCILLTSKRWERSATKRSARNAREVALSLWRAEKPEIIEGCPVMRFRHVSWGNQSFILPVRPYHPDAERFRQIKDGDIVEFEPLSKGMECALPHELCGYLRIKSVS